MKYAIGIDAGIASVGSAVVMLNDNDEPCRIIRLSSRIFEKAENPKDGSSLAAPRREYRGARRRLRRKTFRKQRIKNLIIDKFGVSSEYIDSLYQQKQLTDIYQIRAESLDRLLDKDDFIRLLIHLSQRRGFKSNRKADANDKKSDAGALLTAVNENNEILKEKGYRTIGEMLFKDEKFADCKRNKAEKYEVTFSRQNYCDEIKCIFESQRGFGNPFATDEFEEKYLEIYLSQRAFDEGPGGDSPYGGNLIEKMIGKCTFEKDEPRAVKASYSFEYFNLLCKVNAIKLVNGKTKRSLTEEERQKVISAGFAKINLTYGGIRKLLGISEDSYFNISYSDDKTADEIEKKTKFSYLPAYHIFKKAFSSEYDTWSKEKRNSLAYVLTVYKNDSKIEAWMREKGFSETEIKIASSLPSFTKTANLSVKAIDKITPYLEKGMLYNEACESAGYNFKADEKSVSEFLPQNPKDAPELGDITNPVVRRAVSQMIKVINAIIREMGESPVYLNIELARELAKNRDERNKIEKSQKENAALNEKLMDELRNNYGVINPTGMDLIKLKLWKEQDGVCPYSQQRISIERLFEPGYVDVDHIVPYSISFDDRYNNKVLVLSSENRQKGNRLPLEYLKGKRAEDFIIHIQNSKLRSNKKKNLLKESITEEELARFKERNLSDTQYISRFMLNYIKRYLKFAPNSSGMKNVVKSVNGSATAYLRKRWGINKVRENGDCHHAVDALVVACTTTKMIRRISDYAKYTELKYSKQPYIKVDKETGEVLDFDKFPLPYKWFRDELKMRCSDNPSFVLSQNPLPNYASDEDVKPIFVSRMPRRKVSGSAHKETIRKPYEQNGVRYTVSRVPITSLKLDKDGEIKDYFNPEADMLLYNALKNRLAAFGGNAQKAFEEDLYAPKGKGKTGPLVKKVKIIEKATLTVPVLEDTAVADNGSMVRVDVFFVENEGYYLVPIYVSDTVKDKLPNKAIVAHKSYDDWKVMDDKDFVFSLYPNDLIKVKSKNNKEFSLVNKDSTIAKNISSKEFFCYYKSTGISNATITVINHDNTYTIPSLGVKGLLSIEKYQVDVLGNITKVTKEKRMGFK